MAIESAAMVLDSLRDLERSGAAGDEDRLARRGLGEQLLDVPGRPHADGARGHGAEAAAGGPVLGECGDGAEAFVEPAVEDRRGELDDVEREW